MMSNKYVINEGARDNMLAVYIPLFQQRGIETSVSQLKQFLLNKFVQEAGIKKLSERSNYYLAGVARYYFNGELTSNKRLNAFYPNFKDRFNKDICERLNALIGILRLAYIDSVGTQFEQPEDFGTLSLKQLLRKYGKKIDQELGINKPVEKEEEPVDNNTKAGKKYTYDILYSFEDARKYFQYTEPGAWCITYGKQHYNGYVSRYGIHYVIFLAKGFENVPRKIGKGFTKQKPHDAYGNSMIAVLQSNRSPEPVIITSRWNHGSYVDGTQGIEADRAYTKEEFLNVIGCDESVLERCFEQWKRNKPKENTIDRKGQNAEKLEATRNFKYMQMLLNGGMKFTDMPRSLIANAFIVYKTDEKNVDNSILSVCTNVNGHPYWTISDRKQLKFNDIVASGENFWGGRNEIDENGYYKVLLGDYRSRSYMLYNIRTHNFVSVEGCKKFKYIGDSFSYAWAKAPYDIVGINGKQFGLINVKTGKAVRTRTGAEWFEGITPIGDSSWFNVNYSNKVRLPRLNGEKILKLMYDSSADIKYIFSVETGKFIDLNDAKEFNLSEYQELRHEGYIGLSKYEGKTKIVRYKNAATGEWLQINGKIDFADSIERKTIEGNVLYKVRFLDESCLYFFNSFDNIVTFNGQPIVKDVDISEERHFFIFQFSDRKPQAGRYWRTFEERNEEDLLLNPFTGEFYHDDRNGYWFTLVSIKYRVYIKDKETEETYELPWAEEAKKKEDATLGEMKAVRNNFNMILERLNLAR